ncbi:MAG: hypothetical protein ACTSUO_00090 [Candidatus Thorarchaeota archaeon]
MDNLIKRSSDTLHEGRYNGIKKRCHMGNTRVTGLGSRGNDTRYIISNVPLSIQDLPQLGMKHGMNIRCMIPLSYRNYASNLFQRLLKPDGTWFDNVSGVVTQVRSAPSALPDSITKEVLEENLEISSVLLPSRVRTTRSEIDA